MRLLSFHTKITNYISITIHPPYLPIYLLKQEESNLWMSTLGFIYKSFLGAR